METKLSEKVTEHSAAAQGMLEKPAAWWRRMARSGWKETWEKSRTWAAGERQSRSREKPGGGKAAESTVNNLAASQSRVLCQLSICDADL